MKASQRGTFLFVSYYSGALSLGQSEEWPSSAHQLPADRKVGHEGDWSCHRDQVLFATHAVTKAFIQNMYRLLQFNKKKETR